ncbi:MAG TPA: TonB-dependent receptor, partial [bacterium]|nr:TonB-dependent receptor [bacterium]
EGWMTNPNPDNSNHHLPGGQSSAARLTLKYDGAERRLHVKFKGGFTSDTSDNWFGDLSQNICPPGGTATPYYRQYDDCTANRFVGGTPDVLPYNPNLNFNAFNNASFAVATPLPIYRDGVPYEYTDTALGILSISYDITPGLTLSSVTALEWTNGQEAGASPSPGVDLVDVGASDQSQEFSQELRLISNWQDSWFNFMVGALYNPTTRTDKLDLVIVGAGSLAQLGTYNLYTDSNTRLKSETDGVFGQFTLRPNQHWDLSAGVRYTYVEKHFTSMAVFHNYPALFSPGPPGEDIQNVPENLRSVRETAVTPEVTLRYSPNDDVMTFASYKEGYKGPGFNVDLAAPSFNATNVSPFAGERTEGFEGGIKAELFSRQVALTAVGYRYNYRDLQVAVTDVAAHRSITRNGADARVQGIELTTAYSPQHILGLSLNSYINYNKSYYSAFDFAACYSQQTLAEGCVTTATLAYQNLTGRTLSLAPRWVGFLGGSYKLNPTGRYTATLSAGLTYSSSYLAQNSLQPLSYQGSYVLMNFGLHVGPTDGAWEVALLCRDCTNRYYLTEGVDAGAGTGNATTASSLAYIGRPQEILLQVTVHPWRH